MARYLLSPRARGDLDAIWRYSEANWGADQAEDYLRAIHAALEALEALAVGRRNGRACDDIRTGYFRWSVRAHIIFYRMRGDDLDVSRILDQRMDFRRHL